MPRLEHSRINAVATTHGILCILFLGVPSHVQGGEGSDWKKPFSPDPDTVVLYHFDEGKGDEALDACGDEALTLHAHKTAAWGSHPGFGTTARFARRADDGDLRVGPTNNDKLDLRTCTKAWTIEAWIRYTGPGGQEAGGRTYASICSTDDEGFGLPGCARGGWTFFFNVGKGGVGNLKDGLLPAGRFIGRSKTAGNRDTSIFLFPENWPNKVKERQVTDHEWHHVAWQFRHSDQVNSFFLDGSLVGRVSLYEDLKSPRIIVNDFENTCLPFVVGGWIHSQDPPFFIKSGNFEGEIDELRISKILRYPMAQELAIIHQKLPKAWLNIPYLAKLETEAQHGAVVWELLDGKLPEGLELDKKQGIIQGIIQGDPQETVADRSLTIGATDEAGQTDKYTFSLSVVRGQMVTESLPVAFVGLPYQVAMKTSNMAAPTQWKVISGDLPRGVAFSSSTGQLEGVPTEKGFSRLVIQVTDANGLQDRCELKLSVLPRELHVIEADENTVVLYDWQGPNGKLIRDVMGDDELTLTWTNMGGDKRVSWPGRKGVFPMDNGRGEHGWATKGKGIPKLDLKTCQEEWTVEAWVRRAGPICAYGEKVDTNHQPFDYGHICGTYDNSKRGVWELYLSDHDSADGSMAPGVHFLGAEPDEALMDLHPWKRPDAIVGSPEQAGIRDTEWHHVAWQYSYAEDLHQLFLDGRLIWQMESPDGRKLINNRQHDAQFSVSSRLRGYSRYGGDFNFRGFGNFFGQIGEIRISNKRRY
ncbi:putative Ig domain-containing protein [Adhaeretor mobilis]|uniref:Ig domain protein n=1 Tax=Adhaeretor mobilis TaxID=1930276 RepID=A0A517MTI2_9BACT|nr:putative Ig domain-containing protein [Adhaeretor mobilis]QDS98190.1 Putative Ig domain protein [Adhaeretor mobilis]